VIRPVVGVLADGTAFYAPLGEVVEVVDALVTCHMCGWALRSVTAHLRAHGWTKQVYCEAFGLERGQSLEGPPTRKLRAAALAARLVFDPAIREGSAAGRDRAVQDLLEVERQHDQLVRIPQAEQDVTTVNPLTSTQQIEVRGRLPLYE